MKLPLTGIIPPMITPLRGRDELDVSGMEKLIEHLLNGGVSGLFILGTTGEGPSLSYRLRREVIERVCKQVHHRVPILVGITDTAFVESVNLARHAAECGADAVVAAPPYYMPEGQPELQEWLDHLVPELPLPLFLYNMPPLTKVAFELETIRHAAGHSRIVGLKDSSGDLNYFKDVAAFLRQRPDWTLLIGPEEKLLASLQLGGHGGVSGGANVFPKLYVRLYQAWRAGDVSRARTWQDHILHVSRSLYHIGRHPSAVIKGIKCALRCLGICDDFMAEPFHRFREPERELLRGRLKEIEAALSKLPPE
ncbi:MAG TPA: dihydrodipicolinate synthase family protein [Verrucomicrobiae bacterium]|nr:dihydrodipicolinate synthase family protein [Verrucomicrobiae bacterium]